MLTIHSVCNHTVCMVFSQMDGVMLTKIQASILHFVRERCESSSPPSYRDIQRHFGFRAVGSVQDHVRSLMKKGRVEKAKGELGKRAQGIVLAGYRSERFRRISVFGEIAAGNPLEANQIELGALMIDETMAHGNCFALRVQGDSMVNAGILEGDNIIVEQTKTVRSGDIVVALLDGENTVKRYVKKDRRRFLVPENPRLRPIEIKSQRLEIQGKVVGLVRKKIH